MGRVNWVVWACFIAVALIATTITLVAKEETLLRKASNLIAIVTLVMAALIVAEGLTDAS